MIRVRKPRTIGRYLLSLALRPFLATLAVVLPALLMERLLRLFALVATADVPALSVMRLLVDLLPQYLGLALPAALFVAVYAVIARLSAENELDALQNAGLSLGRISRPFFLIGLLAAGIGFGLYGYLQPYARYAYRAAFQAATNGNWNAAIVPGEIIHVSRDLVVMADHADRIGGRLHRVVIYQQPTRPGGEEKITTARDGRLLLSPDGTELLLSLDDAIQVDAMPPGGLRDDRSGALTAPHVTVRRPFALRLRSFRPRGADEREMSLGALWTASRHPSAFLPPRRIWAELHGRIVRALSLALIPVLAVPLGLAGKRVRHRYGIVAGVVILVLYYHAIQLAESLGTANLADPRPAIWIAAGIFATGCIAGFRRASLRPGESPLDGIVGLCERIRHACLRAGPGRMRSGKARIGQPS